MKSSSRVGLPRIGPVWVAPVWVAPVWVRLVWVGVALWVLSGCSLLVPKLEKPTLSVVSVELLKSDVWHQELKVRLRVQNPNDRVLPVKSLTYELDVDGQELAHGMSNESFVVPALGEAEFDMSVSANMASMLLKLLSRGATPVNYHILGNISLSQGLWRSIAFDDQGTFRWQ